MRLDVQSISGEEVRFLGLVMCVGGCLRLPAVESWFRPTFAEAAGIKEQQFRNPEQAGSNTIFENLSPLLDHFCYDQQNRYLALLAMCVRSSNCPDRVNRWKACRIPWIWLATFQTAKPRATRTTVNLSISKIER